MLKAGSGRPSRNIDSGAFWQSLWDVATAVERAVALGATVARPLADNGAIEFAHLRDPHGNRLGIWRPKA